MPTANEQILDAMIMRQIGLLRFSHGVARDAIRLLNESEKDLREILERRLQYLAGRGITGADFKSERFTAMLAAIAAAREEVFKDIYGSLREEMLSLVKSQATYVTSGYTAAAPVVFDMVKPAAAQLLALVNHNPFQGATLKDWAASIQKQDIARITNAIRIGLTQGESIPEITRRVVGLQALGGKNGATQLTRNQWTSLTRTAVNSFSNEARRLTLDANADLFTEEVFVATLDERTTLVCASFDGKRFAVGQGPRPPLHWGCRSLRVAIVTPELIGERPFKPFTEQQFLREFAAAQGIPVVSKRYNLPRGLRVDFDKFARARARELIGQVPARTSFQEFLSRQSATFKRDYLGDTRAALFTKGDLSLSDLIDGAGRPLTLEQLAKMEADAFRAAGLDPERFAA